MFKNVATALPLIDDKAVNFTIEKIQTIKETYYFTYLFTALSSSAFTNHEFMKLRNSWTFGTALTECS